MKSLGQFFLYLFKLFFTIKQNKIENRKTGEKLKGAKFIGLFGFYIKIDLAQNDENVEFARSGRRPSCDNDSIVTRVFPFLSINFYLTFFWKMGSKFLEKKYFGRRNHLWAHFWSKIDLNFDQKFFVGNILWC